MYQFFPNYTLRYSQSIFIFEVALSTVLRCHKPEVYDILFSYFKTVLSNVLRCAVLA